MKLYIPLFYLTGTSSSDVVVAVGVSAAVLTVFLASTTALLTALLVTNCYIHRHRKFAVEQSREETLVVQVWYM